MHSGRLLGACDMPPFMPTYRLASWSFDPATLRSSFPVEIVDWWSDVSGALAAGFPIRVSQKLCEMVTPMSSTLAPSHSLDLQKGSL